MGILGLFWFSAISCRRSRGRARAHCHHVVPRRWRLCRPVAGQVRHVLGTRVTIVLVAKILTNSESTEPITREAGVYFGWKLCNFEKLSFVMSANKLCFLKIH